MPRPARGHRQLRLPELHEGHHALVTDPDTSARLGRIRQKDTAPELAVRRVLTALGLRYRTQNRDLPGSPDIANRTNRWVVLVHGCYWHRHAGCPRTTSAKRNAAFWSAKFEANQERDRRVARRLRALGYRVVTVWECQTADAAKLRKRLSRLPGATVPDREGSCGE